MQRLGFIHDMIDVKVLILYVAARSNYSMSVQEIYELCYVDDSLSYFDVCTAIPEMVASGHLQEVEEGKYQITDRGREDGELTADSLAFTVRQKAENMVAKFNRQLKRSSYVKTQVLPRENGDITVIMRLDDEVGNLLTIELMAPDQRQAVRLTRMFEKKAEMLYAMTMNELLDAEDDLDE